MFWEGGADIKPLKQSLYRLKNETLTNHLGFSDFGKAALVKTNKENPESSQEVTFTHCLFLLLCLMQSC